MPCYHAVKGYLPGKHPRYGQEVRIVTSARRGVHPRNILVQFSDGEQVVTSIGCIRFKCEHSLDRGQ